MIQVVFTTGLTLYAIVLNPFTAQVWNTSTLAWENPTPANWANYAIALTEFAGTGIYTAAFPAGITAAAPYGLIAYERLGTTPAATDTVVSTDQLNWNGAAETIVLDPTTAIPVTGNAANTLADCLNAARAQAFGAWTLNGTTLTLYAPDGTTIVRQFTLNSASAPTQRS